MMDQRKRFLSCPLNFDESEELLEFRFTTLVIMIILITAYTFVFALLDILGINHVGLTERYINLFHTILGVGLFFYLRRSKANYASTLYVLLIVTFVAFSLALVFVPDDEFRVIWFFILIIGTYIVGDVLLGVLTSIAGLVVIISFSFIFDLHISSIAHVSIIGSYIVVSFFMYAYTKRIDRFQEELIEKNAILEHLATYDALTGIMNRRLFLEMAEKYLSEAKRLGKYFYFLMVDIDHFKKINDTYGHHIGDEVLRRFSDCIGGVVRRSDLFGRIGGEEFGVVILTDKKEDALTTAERIRAVVDDNTCSVEKQEMNITTSVGLVQQGVEESLESMMQRADAALYRAKNSGRNRVVADIVD